MKKLHSNYKFPLLAIGILLLIGGIFTYQNLKTGLFPDITFPKIKVIADAGQQPVDKMMTTVTIPLENIIRSTEGLQYIRSTTSRGSCEISVFLDWSTDINIAKSQIESFINQSQGSILPNTVFSVEKMNPSILPVMRYSLEGDGLSQVDLKKIATYQVKPFLAATPGVSNIAVIGGKDKEFQVILKPDVLKSLGISVATIQNAVVNSNLLQSNGYISDFNRMYLTLTDNAVDDIDDLQNLVIINSPNRLIRLKDVANIEVHEVKEYVKILANGKNVPIIAIVKQPNANLIEVNNTIEQKIAELAKTLPKGVVLKPYYKQADFVNTSIASIKDVLWIGLVLALLVVILFLRSFSASLVVLFTIPVSLSLTLIVLDAIGYSFNIMTLGAVAAAIGLMIDDVVIIIEQIHKIREEHPKEKMDWIAHEAITHLLPAMIGSSLSTLVIFIPFVLMTGVAGAYFKVMAFSMMIALSASFLVTWLLAPVLSILFTKNKTIEHKQAAKTKWIHNVLGKPFIGIVFLLLCVAILVVVPSKLPSGFLPEMDEGSIVLDYNSPPGTTLEETDNMLQIVNSVLDTQPEVEAYSARLGTQMGFFITEPNRGDYLIKLKDKRSATTTAVSDKIRKRIEEKVPQLTIDFGQVIGDMLGDLMSSVQPIEVKVFGNDVKTLERLSREIAKEIETVQGTADVNDGIIVAGPSVSIIPNVPVLAQLGMTVADFQLQLQTQIEGTVVSSMIDKEQMVAIRLIYPDAGKTSISDIKNTAILLPNGSSLPMTQVATIEIGKGVAEINRENQKSMGVITARLNNRDLGSTLKDIQQHLTKKIALSTGYSIEYGGAYKEQQKAFKELMIILIAAILLVFIVILFLFRKVKIALAIIVIAVLGVAGSLLSLYITRTPLNVGSYTGIIMIVGIIGENSIFTYRQYQESDASLSHIQKIEYAIAARLRPKLMTAFAAIMALAPLALGIGAGAQLHQPLAIAVIGGLVFALPLLLIVLPTILKIIKE
ncbi:efflux RND transporter permease subunit [Polaribacter glomeratus]|uniref:Acriflavine resistance protein B n=1 Tax=Polaribacter glomeratus TaxID=102 RepID=A0A2S7WUA5_9FLAO|nr:efflux RND transporter permease subunit [Polaribacter glomeratus]PQJ81157.1 acriflavine resistance protein B [Polaribacter glomeratus]TXD65711.1 efflux RND transporter permease subunit [Polaribacter glomeratus]